MPGSRRRRRLRPPGFAAGTSAAAARASAARRCRRPARPPGGAAAAGRLPRSGLRVQPAHAARAAAAAGAAALGFDGGGGFGFGAPETVDFGRDSAPVAVRRSGPPGLVMLIVGLAAAAGGAKLGEMVTRNDTGRARGAGRPRRRGGADVGDGASSPSRSRRPRLPPRK